MKKPIKPNLICFFVSKYTLVKVPNNYTASDEYLPNINLKNKIDFSYIYIPHINEWEQ